MDRDKLDMVMNALNRTSVRECEISTKNAHIKIVRSNAAPVSMTTALPVAETVQAGTVNKDELNKPGNDIRSQWVGYFYRGKKADSNPLVKLRDSVTVGQQVGTIVTMNVSHEVISEYAGKLVDVLVEDGQAVEYGQPLLRISRDGGEV